MDCPSCRRPARPEARFCDGCGQALPDRRPVCGACGQRQRTDARFCDGCGAPAQAGERSRDPRAYTPRHLAERILQTRSAIVGQRKQVTVLFIDIRGSVELAAGVDAEEWHDVMSRFFEIVTSVIHRLEGTVNQYTGDGAMALFGAPVAHEDHALRACQAALALRDELRAWAEELKRTRGMGFHTRLGLNSGEVVVGRIGDDLRMDYTAQGHTTSLAARMEQLASADSVYLTDRTAALVRGRFELRDLGEYELKGVAEPVPVFELQGAGPLRTRLDVSRARGLSPFVSREVECAQLEAALARTREAGLQIAGVCGDAGLGKSRLCAELAERWRARGVPVLEASAASQGDPLHVWAELLRALLDVSDDEDEERLRERVAGRFLRLDPGVGDALPVLYALLGVPESDGASDGRRGDGGTDALLRLLALGLRARAAEGLSVLVLEDLHWLDEASEALLPDVCDALADTPTLLLANFRPGYHGHFRLRGDYEQLDLEPLAPDALDALIGSWLGPDPALAPVAERVADRAAGNPFFAEEILQSLIEGGQLRGERGRLERVARHEDLPLPESLHALLDARIDRLDEDARQVLYTAAVIGRRFAGPLLERVSPLDPDALVDALRALESAGMIDRLEREPASEYAFHHPLIQSVAYASQLQDTRRKIHLEVARAILRMEARRPDERAAVIAHHFEQGGDADAALEWHVRAAGRAENLDVPAALFHWRRVRELCRRASAGDAMRAARLRAHLAPLQIGGRAGMRPEEARVLFERGSAFAREARDVAAEARFHQAYGARLGWSGDFVGQREQLERAEALAASLDDPELQLDVLRRAFVETFHRGDLPRALALADDGLERVARLAAALAADDPAANAHVLVERELLLSRANACLQLGRLADAADMIERHDALARRPGSARHGFAGMHTRALVGASLRAFRGEVEAGLEEARAFVALAQRSGSRWAEPVSAMAQGRALLIAGRHGEARGDLERSLERSRAQRLGLEAEASVLALLSAAQLGAGDLEAARDSAEHAVAIARERGTGLWEPPALLACAFVALAAGDPDAAQQSIEAARAASGRCASDGLRGFVEVACAFHARRCGDDAGADEARARAAADFQRVGAAGWAARVVA